MIPLAKVKATMKKIMLNIVMLFCANFRDSFLVDWIEIFGMVFTNE